MALSLGFSLPCMNSAWADEGVDAVESEREVLAGAVRELRVASALVARAKERQARGSRITLDYELLALELAAVIEGIEEYIDGHRLEPRSFPPLRTEYTDVRAVPETTP